MPNGMANWGAAATGAGMLKGITGCGMAATGMS
jgi:hypothetical protein